jgi:hypothetical protein
MTGHGKALTRHQMSPGNSPSRVASCRQRHRNHRSTDLRGLTFSLQTLCSRSLRSATEIAFGCVQKLWTMKIRCGKLRKSLPKLWPEKSEHGFSIT